jgi:hypothetical protein
MLPEHTKVPNPLHPVCSHLDLPQSSRLPELPDDSHIDAIVSRHLLLALPLILGSGHLYDANDTL